MDKQTWLINTRQCQNSWRHFAILKNGKMLYFRLPSGPSPGVDINRDGFKWLPRVVGIHCRWCVDYNYAVRSENRWITSPMLKNEKYFWHPFGPYGVEVNRGGLTWLHWVAGIHLQCYIDYILPSESKFDDVISTPYRIPTNDPHLAPMGSISTAMGSNGSIELLAFTGDATLITFYNQKRKWMTSYSPC